MGRIGGFKWAKNHQIKTLAKFSHYIYVCTVYRIVGKFGKYEAIEIIICLTLMLHGIKYTGTESTS